MAKPLQSQQNRWSLWFQWTRSGCAIGAWIIIRHHRSCTQQACTDISRSWGRQRGHGFRLHCIEMIRITITHWLTDWLIDEPEVLTRLRNTLGVIEAPFLRRSCHSGTAPEIYSPHDCDHKQPVDDRLEMQQENGRYDIRNRLRSTIDTNTHTASLHML